MEFQQSALYGKYIAMLKWQVIRVGGVQMFYKNIPFIGGILKIQRPAVLPPPAKLKKVIRDLQVSSVAIEPLASQDMPSYKRWVQHVSKFCRVVRSGYMPTKTILVNLRPTEEDIFRKFSEAKRRAVRKAQKNGVAVRESSNIKDLIMIKNKSGGFLGFITTFGVDKFWHMMYPEHATIALAYHNEKIVGGILIVFWKTTAFYWIAGATHEGKKLFAPTFLVWEAIKVAKKRGAKNFDFVGVWDERKSSEHHDWKGFTRFKEGFGGFTLYYPVY